MNIKRIIAFILIFISAISLFGCKEVPDVPDKPIVNNNIFNRVQLTTAAETNSKVELALFEKEAKLVGEGNPYDYDYLKVMVEITSPSNKVINVPAFWYQHGEIVLNTLSPMSPSGISGTASTNMNEPQGLETVTPIGDPHYRVRFTPSEAGEHKIKVRVYKYGTLVSTEEHNSIVVENGSTNKGVLEVDKTNNRTFKFSNTGETFVGVGQNTGWYTSSTRKTEDYAVWFSNMNENNMNLTRVWMATWGFALHWGVSYTDFSGRYAQAIRLDRMLDLANENGIYLLLTLVNHGQFSSTVNAEWDKNPYNSKNGGILDNANEFFTNEDAMKAYQNELLYIIARYGYSNNIMAWELFNEVDWCDNYSFLSGKYKTWHQKMSTFLKENDPFTHMVTTSYKGNDGNANSLDSIDFVTPHDYGYSNKNWNTNILKTTNNLFTKYNKPVFFGEIGTSANNGYDVYSVDKTGITLHQGSWAGMMSGGACGAMNWWWDSYVHPNDLYYQFKGAGKFAGLMNLSGSDYKLLNTSNSSVSNSNVGIMGYGFDNRVYGYLYDSAWTYYNQNILNKTNVKISVPYKGTSTSVELYDTTTGEIIKTVQGTISNGNISFNIESVQFDIAFIIK